MKMNISFVHNTSGFCLKLYSEVKIKINICKYKMLMIHNNYRNFFLLWF